jgi:hypothetical protein
MSFLPTAVVLLIIAAVVGLYALAAFRSTRRAEEVVRLPQMASRMGADTWLPLSDSDAREAALATRRCMRCNSKALCDEWLRAPDRGSPVFCPNAAYLRRLRHDARAFR